jgi:hypothetical protein
MARRLPYKHSPGRAGGERPWTIHVPLGPRIRFVFPENDDPIFSSEFTVELADSAEAVD